MKKFITWLMLLCLVLPAYAEEAIKIADVQPDKQYTVELEQTVHLYPPKEKGKRYYTTAQGCATDGTYGYFVTLYKTVNKGAIWKVQLSDWSVVNTAYGLPIDHGNDAAYNSKKHQLVVVNNSPNYDTLTIVNPDTLEIIEQIKPGFESYAISYNAARDQFLIGISGSFDSYITDGDFNIIKRIPGRNTGITKQGMDSDDTYIYFPQWNDTDDTNYIVVYDWDGNYINTLTVDSFQEIESMFNVDGEIYIAFAGNGCKVFHGTIYEK